MKRTLNINIGNSIIHIEEEACERLNTYLLEVKQHFGKSADDFEIVSDIENRIAEMFTEMLQSQQKQVIELSDVEVVIELMGSVKDFDLEPEDEPSSSYSQYNYAAYGEKKVYRDTDEAMVAGVCSGLSHYLKIDVSILRVIAVMTVLLGGSGLLAYLILWITIPKAQSRAEKMAMKGEAFNLQGFKRNFEEELSNLKENFKNAGDQMRPFVRESGTFVTQFVDLLGTFMQGAGKTILKIIAVLIMICASMAQIAALVSVAALLGFWDASTAEIFPLNIVDKAYFSTFAIAVLFVVMIPLFALILLSIRVAFNSRSVNKMFSYGLLVVWLGALSVAIFFTARISSEFKEEAEFTHNIPVKAFPVYTLSIDRSRFFSREDSLRYQLNDKAYTGRIIQDDERGPFKAPRNVSIRIEKSEGVLPSLTESYSSQGINFETALYHAKNIHYDFTQKDSVLKFSPELHLMKNVNWRNQQVELLLRVPVGAKLNIDRDLDRYLQGYSLWDCGDEDHRGEPYQGIMTAEGLKCVFDQ